MLTIESPWQHIQNHPIGAEADKAMQDNKAKWALQKMEPGKLAISPK